MLALFLCVHFLAIGVFAVERQESGEQEEGLLEAVLSEEESQMPVWKVSLPDGLVVEPGEDVSFLTVAPEMLPEPANGFYPGVVVIETGGQIVVKNGGSLSIGKLAVGSSEPGAVLRGVLEEDCLILVEPGGCLMLNGVTLDVAGEGVAVVQEDGGLLELYDTDLTGLVRWGAPVVDNSNKQAKELWLEKGTQLTEELLPVAEEVPLFEQGRGRDVTLGIQWTLEDASGDEITLEGIYLDENGEAVLSVRPLTATVRWYLPETLTISGVQWLGENAAIARLRYIPPSEEMTEIWGEVSVDGGSTWRRWEDCFFDEDQDYFFCTFILPDSEPRLYRIAAVGMDEGCRWVSEELLLPRADDNIEDTEGNRGGSVNPVSPEREPEPAEDEAGSSIEPPLEQKPKPVIVSGNHGSREDVSSQAAQVSSAETEEKPVAQPQPSQTEAVANEDREDDTQEACIPAMKPENASSNAAQSLPSVQAGRQETAVAKAEEEFVQPSEEDRPISGTQPQKVVSADSPAPLPVAAQGALWVAGLAGCVLAGLAVGGVLYARKSKK